MLNAVSGCWWAGKYITILQQLREYQDSSVKLIFQTKRGTKETFIHFIHVLVVNDSYTEMRIPHWLIPEKWRTVTGATQPAMVTDVLKPRCSICPSGFSWKAREAPHSPPWSSWPQNQAWFQFYGQNGRFYSNADVNIADILIIWMQSAHQSQSTKSPDYKLYIQVISAYN